MALVVGLGAGWFLGRSADDGGESSSPAATTAATTTVVESETTVPSGEEEGQGQAVQDQLDDAMGALADAEAEIAVLTVDRDNEVAHNELLQSWFTPEVRARSERTWNAEVDRACVAVDEPTLENTTYSRVMELMGTHADLVVAVGVCRADG